MGEREWEHSTLVFVRWSDLARRGGNLSLKPLATLLPQSMAASCWNQTGMLLMAGSRAWHEAPLQTVWYGRCQEGSQDSWREAMVSGHGCRGDGFAPHWPTHTHPSLPRTLTECLTSDHKQRGIISASCFSRAGLFVFCLFFLHSLQIISLFSCRG